MADEILNPYWHNLLSGEVSDFADLIEAPLDEAFPSDSNALDVLIEFDDIGVTFRRPSGHGVGCLYQDENFGQSYSDVTGRLSALAEQNCVHRVLWRFLAAPQSTKSFQPSTEALLSAVADSTSVLDLDIRHQWGCDTVMAGPSPLLPRQLNLAIQIDVIEPDSWPATLLKWVRNQPCYRDTFKLHLSVLRAPREIYELLTEANDHVSTFNMINVQWYRDEP